MTFLVIIGTYVENLSLFMTTCDNLFIILVETMVDGQVQIQRAQKEVPPAWRTALSCAQQSAMCGGAGNLLPPMDERCTADENRE